LNVLFRVVADAKCEEFHNFACKIFVRMAGDALIDIEPFEHRWAFANREKE